MNLSNIALKKSERGLITGGVGSGKSTLMEELILDFWRQYSTGRVVIADTKPRFRAEWQLNGTKAKSLYAHWDHGPTIPGSVVGDLSREDCGLSDAWLLGHRIVILQTDETREWPAILRGLAAFFRQARASRPQLVAVDEAMDFFGSNGQPIAGLGDDKNIILRTARAGRERGLGLLAGMQRPIGVPITIVQELTKLYLFRLDNISDMDRLYDLGIPENIFPPSRDHEFVFWERNKKSALLKLKK